MKKETKRYFLVEYCGTKQIVLDTKAAVEQKLEEVRLYNNRKTSKYLCGNITVNRNEQGKYVVTTHIYNKLTQRSTITDLDNETSKLSERELIVKYADKLKTLNGYYPDINVAYFETKDAGIDGEVKYEKGIKYIPVLYKEDLEYLDQSYIDKCLKYHANKHDVAFFKSLEQEFTYYRMADQELEDIYVACDKVKNQSYLGYGAQDLYYPATRLYKKLIYERDKNGTIVRDNNGKYQISRRRQRDFGFFIKNYDMLQGKAKSPLGYNYSMTQGLKSELELIKRQIAQTQGKGPVLK